MEETSGSQVRPILESTEQQMFTFYGKPLIVVRLPDGVPAVSLNSLCENMGLEPRPQLRRIQRTKAIASGLASTRIETEGGSQIVYVLTLRVVPGWLFGIDANRVKSEVRLEIERYQAECVDVLYQWASTPRIEAPANLIPEQPIEKPTAPEPGAGMDAWRIYHQQMTEFLDWQISIEQWRGNVEGRLENLEAVIPTILERLPDPTITPAHQNTVKWYISQWHKASGKPFATLYSALYTAFAVPTYSALREDEWGKIEQWLKKQLAGASGDEGKPEQGRLL